MALSGDGHRGVVSSVTGCDGATTSPLSLIVPVVAAVSVVASPSVIGGATKRACLPVRRGAGTCVLGEQRETLPRVLGDQRGTLPQVSCLSSPSRFDLQIVRDSSLGVASGLPAYGDPCANVCCDGSIGSDAVACRIDPTGSHVDGRGEQQLGAKGSGTQRAAP